MDRQQFEDRQDTADSRRATNGVSGPGKHAEGGRFEAQARVAAFEVQSETGRFEAHARGIPSSAPRRSSRMPYLLAFIIFIAVFLVFALKNASDPEAFSPFSALQDSFETKGAQDPKLLIPVIVDIDEEGEKLYGSCVTHIARLSGNEWWIIVVFSREMDKEAADTAGLILLPAAIRSLQDNNLINQGMHSITLEIKGASPDGDKGESRQKHEPWLFHATVQFG